MATRYATHARRRLHATGRHVCRPTAVHLTRDGALAVRTAAATGGTALGQIDDALAVLSRTRDADRGRLADEQAVARTANVFLAGRSDLDGLQCIRTK